MSFAAEVRAEIAQAPLDQACCARVELAAALIASSGISIHGKGIYRIALSSSEAKIVRRYFSLVKKYFDVTCEIRVLRTDRLNGQTRYQLVFPDESAQPILSAVRLLDADALFGVRGSPDASLFRYGCCRTAFLRASFLFCGTISNPEKSYHIEYAAPTKQFAQSIIETLRYFEIHAKNTCRKTKEVVYLKGSEATANVLTLLGAHTSVLEFENVRITKELHGSINRQVNCDNSNINRSMASAEKQIADIRFIDAELGLDRLPRTLKAVAQIRLENPEISLAGLGELMHPPLGKSGVNARFRRIADIADRLRSGEEVEL